MYRLFFVLILILFSAYFFSPSYCQREQLNEAQQIYQKAKKAYTEKDYGAYLTNLEQVNRLRNNHPTVIYNLAGAYALIGKKVEAIACLKRVAAMGMVFSPEKDSDFSSIKETEEFKSLLVDFEANRKPFGESKPSIKLLEKGLVTESVAYDSKRDSFYVGSVHKRKIVSISGSGEEKEFATEKDGLWAVLGMKIDTKNDLLWASMAAIPQMSGFKPEQKNQTAIIKFDLKKRKLLKKYLPPNNSTTGQLIGDLVVTPSGDVYATDSLSSAIYLISQKKDEMEVFIKPGSFVSLQGLDLSTNSKELFFADYSLGIFKLDLASQKITQIVIPDNLTVLGIDGLYYYQNSLIAIQNGTNPHRVVRLYLDKQAERIEKSEILEVNNPIFDEPTLGVIVGNYFHYIANSQWGSVDESGKLGEKLFEHIILKTELH
ncbi:MAG: hypothetical protein JNN15_14285 [Blastocatellia bacterium]|nr:hypothetical protein [Blastocatellia bacterium]